MISPEFVTAHKSDKQSGPSVPRIGSKKNLNSRKAYTNFVHNSLRNEVHKKWCGSTSIMGPQQPSVICIKKSMYSELNKVPHALKKRMGSLKYIKNYREEKNHDLQFDGTR